MYLNFVLIIIIIIIIIITKKKKKKEEKPMKQKGEERKDAVQSKPSAWIPCKNGGSWSGFC